MAASHTESSAGELSNVIIDGVENGLQSGNADLPQHSTPKMNPAKSSYSSPSTYNQSGCTPPLARKSLSPLLSRRAAIPGRDRGDDNDKSGSELEANTIQKQRKELQLLIQELRDRDRELNEMVTSHQRQLSAWEEDRQRVLSLEQRCCRMEGEVHVRNEQIKGLAAQIKIYESEDKNKSTALESTQEQLAKISEEHSHTSMHVQDLEDKTHQLNTSVREMSASIGELEAREQELLTMLRLKDKDLVEASNHISELSTRLKKVDFQHKDSQQREAEAKRQAAEWKQRHSESRQDGEKLKADLSRMQSESEENYVQLQRARQEVADLNKDAVFAGEREMRKDDVIDLQRSKQDRTDAELSNLRQLYERQQRELSLLHLNLESSKDLISKQQASLENSPILDGLELPSSRLSSHSSPGKRSPARGSRSPYGGDLHSSYLSTQENGDLDFSLPASKDLEASPTSKLHRLLTESRQMVQSLEKSTLPLYVSRLDRSKLSDTSD